MISVQNWSDVFIHFKLIYFFKECPYAPGVCTLVYRMSQLYFYDTYIYSIGMFSLMNYHLWIFSFLQDLKANTFNAMIPEIIRWLKKASTENHEDMMKLTNKLLKKIAQYYLIDLKDVLQDVVDVMIKMEMYDQFSGMYFWRNILRPSGYIFTWIWSSLSLVFYNTFILLNTDSVMCTVTSC